MPDSTQSEWVSTRVILGTGGGMVLMAAICAKKWPLYKLILSKFVIN